MPLNERHIPAGERDSQGKKKAAARAFRLADGQELDGAAVELESHPASHRPCFLVARGADERDLEILRCVLDEVAQEGLDAAQRRRSRIARMDDQDPDRFERVLI